MILFWMIRHQLLKVKPGCSNSFSVLMSSEVWSEAHPSVDFFKARISQSNYLIVYFPFRDDGWSYLIRCPIRFIFNIVIAFIVVRLNASSTGSPDLCSIHLVPIVSLYHYISITASPSLSLSLPSSLSLSLVHSYSSRFTTTIQWSNQKFLIWSNT